MDTGLAIGQLTLFVGFVGIIGMVLFILAVMPRRKNLLVTTAAFLVWLAIGFWWVIDDPLTTLGMTGDYVDILLYIPFILAVACMLEYMSRANQVEMKRKFGGREWTEFGTPPSTYESPYEQYKRELQGRTRGVHYRRRNY